MNKAIAVLQLLPALIGAIRSLEAAIPDSGKGNEKREALRAILEASGAAVDGLLPLIEQATAIVVALFNKTGVFQK